MQQLEPALNERHYAVIDKYRSWMEIAQSVIEARSMLGLTQQQLAERAGTTQSRVSEVESMRGNLRLDTLDRIARALGMMVTLRRASTYAIAAEPNVAWTSLDTGSGPVLPADTERLNALAAQFELIAHGLRIDSDARADGYLHDAARLRALAEVLEQARVFSQTRWGYLADLAAAQRHNGDGAEYFTSQHASVVEAMTELLSDLSPDA